MMSITSSCAYALTRLASSSALWSPQEEGSFNRRVFGEKHRLDQRMEAREVVRNNKLLVFFGLAFSMVATCA